jgi:hypothetical protein
MARPGTSNLRTATGTEETASDVPYLLDLSGYGILMERRFAETADPAGGFRCGTGPGRRED